MKPETKYKGSIKLSAIGDALGWITEFEKTPQVLKEKYGSERIEKFFDWKKNVGGRFLGFPDKIKAGSYSDDTQLMLSVARSIKNDGYVDNNYFGKVELLNWLAYSRGAGRTVKTAADKISRKSAQWYNNFFSIKIKEEKLDYRMSGANGAAMRVLPIALANLGNPDKIKEEIFCNSIITHGHPRAILGAMLYGYAINQIIIYKEEDFKWENFITQIGLDFHKKFEVNFIKKPELTSWVKEWNKKSEISFERLYLEILSETQNQLRTIYQGIRDNIPSNEVLKNIGCFDPSTKGSGTSTVVAGIYFASKYSKTPNVAIIEAVNALSSDTDSIAAFTGGLIGALCGQNAIPEKWNAIQDSEYLDSIALQLLSISEDTFVPGKGIRSGNSLKSLNDIKMDEFQTDEVIHFTPLGKGIILGIERHPTLTKGKYNLVMEVRFDIGQTCVFSKLFSEK